MHSKEILKKDYILIILVSAMHFLMIKEVIPEMVHFTFAIVGSLYFFSNKIILSPAPSINFKKK